jgi:mycothiol system anti-sigma-R factor
MACDQSRTLIHAYLDSELDPVRAAEFERHLEQCSACVSELDKQESLRSSIKQAQLYEKAPTALRQKISQAVSHPASIPMRKRSSSLPWLAIAAAILLFAFVSLQTVSYLRGTREEAALSAQIVDAHLRSLQPGHLVDVISTDQHTVKPWFDGKLDFAPPVTDFSAEGFPLQGGRLDVVHGRTVAALAYGRRKHVISVFIWPVSQQDSATYTGAAQGYNWVCWQKEGMQFSAVSDVSPSDLTELHTLLSR